MGAGDAPWSDSVGSAPADHRAFRLGAWTDAGCAGGPHFDPPRREARGANLRIRARRLPGSGMAGCAERREA